MSHSTLITATRPLPQNWTAAYTLVCRKTKGLFTRPWHVGENDQNMIFMATFRPHPHGVTITLTPEEAAGKGLVQQHEHLRKSRVFTPQWVEDFRIRDRSRPVVGQDSSATTVVKTVVALLGQAVEQEGSVQASTSS